uniref:Heat shock protein 90 beta family member 1 n=1 Tax=Apteryx owenii TaxID=8824 RepID=A0A8B9P185_APTOW
MKSVWGLALACTLLLAVLVRADEVDVDGTVEDDLGKSREGSRTDDEVVQREEEAIQLDGLNASQIKEIREKSEKFAFQAEVNRMMKLIINSLYKNKECDKEKNMLHVTDTGIGMTKEELIKNLGTIAKSGTSEFLNKMTEMQDDGQSTSELIGQFGVGFYSAFLVADRVIVTSKHNNDTQHIWESDSNEFSVIDDPRGNTLGRGTTISLVLKEEASDYLELDTVKNLVKKYSQFINFPIYVWSSKTETVEEPIEEEEAKEKEETDDDEAAVEEEEEEKKPKTKKVEKTVWDWELMNDIKPIWQRPSKEVEEDEYKAFYKTFSKEHDDPMAYIHFTAEGEVTFKSILFVPNSAPRGLFDEYGSKKSDFIKLYVRRVFITDDFHDMMPKYLNFVKGVVDSDDLPLNVSRETLQQHKLLKAESSPFVERLLKKGYEVIYLTEPVDEYCIQALPEFDGKRFQNVAKEGVKFEESEKSKENREALEKEFEPLLNWMKDKALKDKIEKAVLSQRLTQSPCALVASQYGWSGNMERIMKAQAYQTGKDISTNYYASQKKTFEINPRHPLIKDMLRRVKENEDDKTVSDLAVVLFETATLRSGYMLPDTKEYGDRIERMLRLSLNIDLDAKVEEEPEEPEDATEEPEQDEEEVDAEESETQKESTDVKDEL